MERTTERPSPSPTGGRNSPNPIAATTLANARAVSWPTIQSRLHEILAELVYRFTPRMRAGARYLFRSYDLDDFAWDGMQPYMAGVSVENSTRYVYADATYNAYQAHVDALPARECVQRVHLGR